MLKLALTIGAILLCSCRPTTTCDPTKGPTGAGCPDSSPICDPSGICRQLCSGSLCPNGEVCDSSGTPGVDKANINNICQTSCDTNDCPSINGNPHVCYTVTTQPPSGSSDQASVTKMCKRKIEAGVGITCAQLQSPPTWCQAPAFGCAPPNSSNGTGGNILCLAQ